MHDVTIVNENACDGPAIEDLLFRAFNGRHLKKSVNRLRCNLAPLPQLSFTLRDENRLIGTVRVWPMSVSQRWPVLLLGPLAIEPGLQGRGFGNRLLSHTLKTAAGGGHDMVFLVGDEGYYGRFGFAPAGRQNFDVDLPSEDAARLLCAELSKGAAEGRSGLLTPWRCLRGTLTEREKRVSMALAA